MSLQKKIELTPDIYHKNGKVYKVVDRPYVPLFLKYGSKKSKTPVNCLLDSGADRNLFPGSWAATVGISLTKGKKRTILGDEIKFDLKSNSFELVFRR
ncbi:hypothetical protein A3A93_02540 [Candidatus Roizmanbacteria bacterium RIFCSPLOWO2_01_FULL_38_12]|uniref:Peptidase A2 domain-containing protein n=1 Tax=Candidatus Roizmanbacteria bacterium RIFCSPLOWO2_01_FULL_38_12 TaxID=1802061 RepID=A0A1F7J0B6_9BACT|nr:MAG: hypothetical protein A2861_00445 [Candidatus Roizmanbacteria bacterium RIFCSPHIGHO2_01_FULL_38_15]OGK49050.1 MAG: hypothetical protein A3A93_02540 [Candidatus Roizmanbacteria bacterium RIFCSPLOWO2_01_FULL_38_12]